MLKTHLRGFLMNTKRILILGANGMAGRTIYTHLHEKGYDVVGLAKDSNDPNIIACDATDFKKLDQVILSGDYDVVINCIGILNKSAEENKELALVLNSLLPHHLASVTKNTKTRVFQMSTDCVFSGQKGSYTEKDLPDGATWYDRTKAMGELNDDKNLTFRNSIVGPDVNINGIGLFNWFMKQHGNINGFTKAIWTGVTTTELANAMEKAINANAVGLFNCVNNSTISKYELLNLFKKYMNKSDICINPDDKFSCDKSLIRTNFDFDYTVPSYEDMVKEMAKWINNHKNMYPHYSQGEKQDE